MHDKPRGADSEGASTTADQDARDQAAVLRHVLSLYPQTLTELELLKEMTGGLSARRLLPGRARDALLATPDGDRPRRERAAAAARGHAPQACLCAGCAGRGVDSRHRVGATGSHSMRQLPRRDSGLSHGSREQRPQPVAPVRPPSPAAETTAEALHRIRGAAESQGTERFHEAVPVEHWLPRPRSLRARRCGVGGDAAPTWLD
jgi:hypothetical protein